MGATKNSLEKRDFFERLNNSYYKPEIYAAIGLFGLSIILSFASEYFLTANNIINLFRQVSLNAIIACGMTFVILTGGIDLSVGSIVAVTGTFIAGFIKSGMPIPLSILIGLAIGIGFGVINGLIVAYTNIPAIIVTLASMSMARRYRFIILKWISNIRHACYFQRIRERIHRSHSKPGIYYDRNSNLFRNCFNKNQNSADMFTLWEEMKKQ